ncbi:MAG TPA: indole-3-glycerol phosphate synthase TrpC [Myxococcota bacterium]|nr:indole-3-glycerol phosphate synthase TrpC [Myxococcota bacterium]
MTILGDILAHKTVELAAAKKHLPQAQMEQAAYAMRGPTRGFRAALHSAPRPRIIAEIKRRSPSRGEIRAAFDPAECAKAYSEAGAAAISVLTDERFFGGGLDQLRLVRAVAPVPLLRKDFVVDPYQIDESRVAGADAVLLIVAALPPAALYALRVRAAELGLDALVEVHDERELETALAAGADLVGINNRDLRTFSTDLAVTERLAPKVPGGVTVVAESGIFSNDDVQRLEAAGAQACLIGESLMREPDLGLALRRLRGQDGESSNLRGKS